MTAAADFALRRYEVADEEAAIALWQRTWQAAYPQIDFAARLEWWRKRWRGELLPAAEVVVAESGGAFRSSSRQSIGDPASAHCCSPRQGAFHRAGSISTSMSITSAPWAFTSSTDLRSPAKARTRFPASRFTA
jgi:hypothetical protein